MGGIPLGVPNLDIVLDGGLPESQLTVIAGSSGAGKASLVQQIACLHAAGGGHVLYVTTVTEPHSSLVAHLSSFSFFDPSLLGENIKFINIFPISRQGLSAVTSTLLRSLRYERNPFLIIEGFRSLRDLFGDAREVRTFAYELAGTLASIRATTLITTDCRLAELQDAPEAMVADGVIVLDGFWTGLRWQRTLQVVKLGGRKSLKGPHFLEIGDNGLTVYPRFESVYSPLTGELPSGRVGWGSADLDAAVGGGLPRGSATLLLGPVGLGKTTLSLQFTHAGLQSGDNCVYLSPSETAERLAAKSARLDLDLGPALATGALRVVNYNPVDSSADQVAWELCNAVQAGDVNRVVIDGLGAVVPGLDPARVHGYVSALLGRLRQQGATALATLHQEEGEPLPFLARRFDNLILGRVATVGGERRRYLSVAKMRDSAHPSTIWEIEIGSGGARLVPAARNSPVPSKEGQIDDQHSGREGG